MRNYQVPGKFLTDVYALVTRLKGSNLYFEDFGVQNTVKSIEGVLEAKLEGIAKRQAFTAYKTAAPGSAEREMARDEYLDVAGIHSDWRSGMEIIG